MINFIFNKGIYDKKVGGVSIIVGNSRGIIAGVVSVGSRVLFLVFVIAQRVRIIIIIVSSIGVIIVGASLLGVMLFLSFFCVGGVFANCGCARKGGST